jgi:hypothetical protein
MPHTLLVAAIFTVYMGSMIAFGAYIWRTGVPREHDDTGDAPDRERDPGPVPLRLAA